MKIRSTKHEIKNFRGVTIVELLLYLALVSLFLTVLVQLFVSILKLRLMTQSTSSLTTDTRFVIARMGYDIQNARGITAPALGVTSNTLQFVSGAGGNATYALDGNGNLILTISGVGTKLNGVDTAISSITFRQIEATGTKPTIQVIFTINSNVIESSGVRSQTIQTTYGLR